MTKRSFKAERVYSRMVGIRRALHRHPELAFEEQRTAQLPIEELERLGISYSYPGKGGAVVGRLCERHEVTVALRAEMDALPGAENTDLPFTSSLEGKMHASTRGGLHARSSCQQDNLVPRNDRYTDLNQLMESRIR